MANRRGTNRGRANATNGRVMVEFIQKTSNVNDTAPTQINVDSPASNEVGVEVDENVEYLEEVSVGDEYVPMLTLTHADVSATNYEEVDEDTFYPNAVHCLIALYCTKRGKQIDWEDIACQMRESFFNFDADQVRRKFEKLRRQYYAVVASGSCEGFKYFDQMLELDEKKLLEDHPTERSQIDNTALISDDEQSFLPQPADAEYLDKDVKFDILKKVEIVKPIAKQNRREPTLSLPKDQVSEFLVFAQNAEHADDVANDIQSEAIIAAKRTKIQAPELNDRSPLQEAESSAIMSLAEYNAQQERRHQEKMMLVRRNLKLQERNIEMQRQLMEALINKL